MAATVPYVKRNRTVKAGLLGDKYLCICLALFIALSCSKARPDPAQHLAHIKAMYQQGHFVEARQAAEEEYRSLNPESQWGWKFKLLVAELLLINGQTEKAEQLLSAPPFTEATSVVPRFRMLQAYCLFRREKGAEAEAEAREALSRAEQAGDYETISDTD